MATAASMSLHNFQRTNTYICFLDSDVWRPPMSLFGCGPRATREGWGMDGLSSAFLRTCQKKGCSCLPVLRIIHTWTKEGILHP